jgi:hypothetical protein
MSPSRKSPADRADAFVDLIACHKASILVVSAGLASLFALAVLIAIGENDGDGLTTLVTGAGGYVAIVGLVLGLPALSYAMVTDRSVEQLREEINLSIELSVTKDDLGDMEARIEAVLTTIPLRLGRRTVGRSTLPLRRRSPAPPGFPTGICSRCATSWPTRRCG